MYLQNGKRLRDLEDKLMVTKGEMWGWKGYIQSVGLTYIHYHI